MANLQQLALNDNNIFSAHIGGRASRCGFLESVSMVRARSARERRSRAASHRIPPLSMRLSRAVCRWLPLEIGQYIDIAALSEALPALVARPGVWRRRRDPLGGQARFGIAVGGLPSCS